MAQYSGIKFGKIPSHARHICVDMQRMFSEDTPWKVNWFPKVIDTIEELIKFNPENTIFTRFIPIRNSKYATGAWKRYYQHWADMTSDKIDPDLLDIVPRLKTYIPPSQVLNKFVYSPWSSGFLHEYLQTHNVDTLIISGGETDICVLATILGAIDLGYRVILAADALCSSHDNTHDSIIELCCCRFSQQIEISDTDEILSQWQ